MGWGNSERGRRPGLVTGTEKGLLCSTAASALALGARGLYLLPLLSGSAACDDQVGAVVSTTFQPCSGPGQVALPPYYAGVWDNWWGARWTQ